MAPSNLQKDFYTTGIQSEIVSYLGLPSQYSCISKSFKDAVLDQKSFRAKEGTSIKTQLSSYLGPNGKGKLQNIDLDFRGATDEDLLWISSHFPNLTSLRLSSNKITDAGILHLATLANLTSLDLGYTIITDAGLPHLASLTKLTLLDLWNTNITDAGVQHLASLKNLESLFLANTKITNAGLPHLATLTNLTSLALPTVTDAGLQYLAPFTNLTSLDLGSSSKITDAGLQYLAPFTNLSSLNLRSNIGITDAGLPYLASLKKLFFVEYTKTKIANSGSSWSKWKIAIK